MTNPTATTSSSATDAHLPDASSHATLLYPDLEQELASTRRMLERYPTGKGDWRPHEKSMPLGRLATHIAELPTLGTTMLSTDELDFAVRRHAPRVLDNADELLAFFDENVRQLLRAIAAADEAALARSWTLRHGEQVVFVSPKGTLMRGLIVSHIVHHRAQLSVYYRMLDVPVPRLYGPSADEPM